MDNVIQIQALHVAWCALLYALLTVVRAPAVWGIGKRADGSNPFHAIQPKISANLSNQFEWPLFFHILCIVLLIQGQESHSLQVSLAWLFIVLVKVDISKVTSYASIFFFYLCFF